jgi:DNA-binding transcriptional ArsR family regulator
MDLGRPLDATFRSPSDVRVLRALWGLPAGLGVSGREVARRAGISHPAASHALDRLGELGLVITRRALRVDYFHLNAEHVLIRPLELLFEEEAGLRDALVSTIRDELARPPTRVSAAFLFGSVARGDGGPSSDVDLAVVCPAEDAERVQHDTSELAHLVRRRFGARVNAIIGSPSLERLRDPAQPGHQLWDRVAAEGIPLLPASGSAA